MTSYYGRSSLGRFVRLFFFISGLHDGDVYTQRLPLSSSVLPHLPPPQGFSPLFFPPLCVGGSCNFSPQVIRHSIKIFSPPSAWDSLGQLAPNCPRLVGGFLPSRKVTTLFLSFLFFFEPQSSASLSDSSHPLLSEAMLALLCRYREALLSPLSIHTRSLFDARRLVKRPVISVHDLFRSYLQRCSPQRTAPNGGHSSSDGRTPPLSSGRLSSSQPPLPPRFCAIRSRRRIPFSGRGKPLSEITPPKLCSRVGRHC